MGVNKVDKLELKQLHEKQLEILKEVDRICKKHKITYYLSWGSALGAIRHKGFIPWDDDIDISMKWTDYIKFAELCKGELNKKLFLQTTESDPFYWNPWHKIRMNNTTSMDKQFSYMRCHYGICIDIFPLIGIPESQDERKRQKQYTSLYKFLCNEPYLCNLNEGRQYKSKLKYMIIPKSIKKYLKKKSLYEITKYDVDSVQLWGEILSEPYDTIKKLNKEIYGEGIEVDFEGLKAKIPVEYDEYLRALYGEYMILPKEADRCGHGETILDLKQPYEYYCTYKK